MQPVCKNPILTVRFSVEMAFAAGLHCTHIIIPKYASNTLHSMHIKHGGAHLSFLWLPIGPAV